MYPLAPAVMTLASLLVISQLWIKSFLPAEQVLYRGAVLEMEPFKDPNLDALGNMLENINIMSRYGLMAKEQGADIIVYPEYAMISETPTGRPYILEYAQIVPDLGKGKVALCDLAIPVNNDQIVRNMSCLAKTLEMYVVFNLAERVNCDPESDSTCPNDNHHLYNLNLVFDRRGVIISKYRKLHLFKEPWFEVGDNEPEVAVFTTDFGVKFTQHICFDLLFYRPSLSNVDKFGIRDVVMSTSWVDFLPFSTAPQSQYGWSRGSGVNLLVAGRHRPYFAATGSGIFTGAVDITKSVYVYDDTRGTQLLINDILTYPDEEVSTDPPSKKPILPASEFALRGQQSVTKVSPTHGFVPGNISNYFHVYIPATSSGNESGTYLSSTETGESIDYTLDWKLEGDDDYYLVLHSGEEGFDEYKFHLQIAALLYCPDGFASCGTRPSVRSTKATFQHFNLTLQFDVSHLYPSIIDQDFGLIGEDKWEFSTKKNGDRYAASMVTTEPMDNIFSATVLARWFDKDPFCKTNVC